MPLSRAVRQALLQELNNLRREVPEVQLRADILAAAFAAGQERVDAITDALDADAADIEAPPGPAEPAPTEPEPEA